MNADLQVDKTKSQDLSEHPLFGNRKRVLAAPTAKPGDNGKKAMIWTALGLLLLVAFSVGIWAANPTGGIGGTIVGWPGQMWQQFLQNQIGGQLGSGLAQQTPWTMARVGGIMAYLMSFASVTLGLVMSLRLKWVRNFLQPNSTFYLHKILSLLSVAFLVLHLSGLALDTYLNIGIWNSLVPFSVSNYRPFWTGLGTVALYGSVLVIITAYLANKLGYKVWRSVHYLTFGIFFISLMHGVMTGSDTSSLWMQLIYVFSGLVVIGLTAMRFVIKPAKVAVALK